MELNEKIKLLRKQHHMTLEEVGGIVGVGKSTVRKWENGDIANMRRDKIGKLAQALHTTPAYLMGWEENALAQEDESVWKIISADETKLHIATWVAGLNHEQLLQVAKILSAILDKEIPPSALK